MFSGEHLNSIGPPVPVLSGSLAPSVTRPKGRTRQRMSQMKFTKLPRTKVNADTNLGNMCMASGRVLVSYLDGCIVCCF